MLYPALFFSGFAALLYQVVWIKQLSIVLGATAEATSIILAAYMVGLGTGSRIAGQATKHLHPVRGFVLCESMAFLAVAAIGMTGVLRLQAGVMFVPIATVFLGASFPFAVEAMRNVHIAYAVNVIGAAAGAITSGLWLVPTVGVAATLLIGLFCTLLSATLGAACWNRPMKNSAPNRRATVRREPRMLLVAFGAGCVAFVSEIIWSRLVVHSVGGSLQAVSVMLAGYLIGMSIGAMVQTGRPKSTVSVALLAGAVLAIGGPIVSDIFARWFAGGDQWIRSAKACLMLMPTAAVFGAAFPAVVRCYAGSSGASCGIIYAVNTAGCVVGALIGPFVATSGFAHSFSGIACAMVMLSMIASPQAWRVSVPCGIAVLSAATLLPADSANRFLALSAMGGGFSDESVYLGVGRNATVRISNEPDGYLVTVDGMPEAIVSRLGAVKSHASYYQWFLTDLAMLARPDAKSLLVVGFGGGGCLESLPARIDQVVVIEIEPKVLEANRRLRLLRASDPLSDPRLDIRIGDARSVLRGDSQRYDAVISQPSHPWTEGSSNLYTLEFVRLVAGRLAPDGVFIQWIEASFLTHDQVRSAGATLGAVFPYVECYQPFPGTCYFISAMTPVRLDESAIAWSKTRIDAVGRINTDDLNGLAHIPRIQ